MSLVLSLLSLMVLLALGGLGLLLLGVAPFLRGVDLAERRGFSTVRWGAVSLAGPVLGLLFAVAAQSSTWLLYGPAVVVTWLGPALLGVVAPGPTLAGGQGAHEH